MYNNLHIVLIGPEDIVRDSRQLGKSWDLEIRLGKIFFNIARWGFFSCMNLPVLYFSALQFQPFSVESKFIIAFVILNVQPNGQLFPKEKLEGWLSFQLILIDTKLKLYFLLLRNRLWGRCPTVTHKVCNWWSPC